MEKRNTIQKQLVLEAVAQLHNHPTAEQVYAQVVKAHPTISKATVYRNLASLSEDGRLRHLPMPAGHAYYYTGRHYRRKSVGGLKKLWNFYR